MATRTFRYDALVDALVATGAVCDMATDDQGWKHLALMFADLGEEGRPLFDRVSACASNYDARQTDKVFTWALKRYNPDRVTIGSFLYLCKDAGIDLSEYVTYDDSALRPISGLGSGGGARSFVEPYHADALPDDISFYSIPDWCLDAVIPSSYDGCALYRFLCTRFDRKAVEEAFRMYRVGVTRKPVRVAKNVYLPIGSCIFPEIDQWGRLRTAQVMSFDDEHGRFGHRAKDIVTGRSYLTWMHTLLLRMLLESTAGRWGRVDGQDRKPYFCLSGLHLLSDARCSSKPVFVVESMSTALCMTCAIPDYLWLSTSGAAGIRLLADAMQRDAPLLADRAVCLIPDEGKGEQWRRAVVDYGMQHVTVFDVMDGAGLPGGDIKDLLLGEKDFCLDRKLDDVRG